MFTAESHFFDSMLSTVSATQPTTVAAVTPQLLMGRAPPDILMMSDDVDKKTPATNEANPIQIPTVDPVPNSAAAVAEAPSTPKAETVDQVSQKDSAELAPQEGDAKPAPQKESAELAYQEQGATGGEIPSNIVDADVASSKEDNASSLPVVPSASEAPMSSADPDKVRWLTDSL